MTPDDRAPGPDPGLDRVLKQWRVPPAPGQLRARLLQAAPAAGAGWRDVLGGWWTDLGRWRLVAPGLAAALALGLGLGLALAPATHSDEIEAFYGLAGLSGQAPFDDWTDLP